MTKAQREKAERLLLKQMLDTNPKLKQMIDALIDKPNVETQNIVKPIIEEELKKARMTGIEIGWQSAFIQAYEKIKNIQSVDEIKVCLRTEADAVRERMGWKSVFDEDGGLIVDREDDDDE